MNLPDELNLLDIKFGDDRTKELKKFRKKLENRVVMLSILSIALFCRGKPADSYQ